MKVRAQFAFVFNLEQMHRCHTCSVTCKNVWTNRKGRGIRLVQTTSNPSRHRYPKAWKTKKKWRGGWELKDGKLQIEIRLQAGAAGEHLRQSGHAGDRRLLRAIHLRLRPSAERALVGSRAHARPVSQITGERMEKITWARTGKTTWPVNTPKRSQDQNMHNAGEGDIGKFENTFHMYLPRICNHCIQPGLRRRLPSGSLYKREEDGISWWTRTSCRGWRMCISSCPYKEGVLQLGIRQGGEVHRPAIRAWNPACHGVLRVLRRPQSGLQRHHVV